MEEGGVPQHNFRLDIDGVTMQEGDTGQMVRSIDSIIAHISRHCTLRTGDIIFTGAPAPPFRVRENQHVTGYLDDRKLLEFNIK